MSPGKLTLAIVDDDSAIVRIVERMVKQKLPAQYDTVTFTDPRAARDWISQHDCDVLVSDVEMPSVGGLALVRAGVRQNPHMQTIFLTAHSAWDRVTAAIEMGVSHYLLKPVDQAELIDVLRRKVDQHSASRVNGCQLDAAPLDAAPAQTA